MTVTDVQKDTDSLTMTITAEFPAAASQVWQLWADPRKLEKWWGPPTYPATFEDHNLRPGGTATYFMTSPEGDKYRGYWNVISVDAPLHLALEDGFADSDGVPDTEKPTTIMRVTIEEQAGGVTRMTAASTFPSVEAMQELLAMGMDEGMRAAMGQMDELVGVGV